MPYYAVKAGKKPGIYTTWTEAKAQVHGFQGAVFKKFPSQEEAQAFLQGEEMISLVEDGKERFAKLSPGDWHAFVDGSFNAKTGVYGYGLVLFTDQGLQEHFGSGQGQGARHRNVAGEILAVETAMDLALQAGAKELTIYHDYSGLRHWALGEWKANLPFTQAYQAKAQAFQAHCKLTFVKIAAHSGHRLNDRADALAKKGAGIS